MILNLAESFYTVLNKCEETVSVQENYQKNAVINLLEDTLSNIDKPYQYIPKLLLEAPTGSGKTIISGAYLDSLFTNAEDISVLWISETPNLTNQSRKKIGENFKLKLFNYEQINRNFKLEPSTVTFINWEKIKNTNARTDTENSYSIDTLVNESKKFGQRIIVIIDEAHVHTNSKLSKEFLRTINPNLILEITATPVSNDYRSKIKININEVKKSGFIKQGVSINGDMLISYEDFLNENPDGNLSQYFVENSLLKRKKLETLVSSYAETYNVRKFNPLVVVQLPNNNNEIMQSIESYLETKGITRQNGKLAVYLSNDFTDELDKIGKDEKVEVLLFKQAIAKGWDCPRASILTVLRNNKSENFVIQTVGRILRMPYLKQYPAEFDELNYGYIYTENTDSIILKNLKAKMLEEDTSIIVPIKNNLEETQLNNMKKFIWDKKVSKSKLYRKVGRKLEEINWLNCYGFNIEPTIQFSMISENIKTEDLVSEQSIQISNTLLIDNYTETDLQKEFDTQLRKYGLDKTLFYEYLYDIIEEYLYDMDFEEDLIPLQIIKIFVGNMAVFNFEISKVLEEEKRNFEDFELKPLDWSLPKNFIVSKDMHERPLSLCTKYPYQELYTTSNTLEDKLIQVVHSSPNVKLWYKNGDSGSQYFNLAYNYSGMLKHFFPDFLIETESEIYILETKGTHLIDSKESQLKLETLNKYQEIQKDIYGDNFKTIKTGFVKEFNTELYIYSGEDLVNEGRTLINWSKLSI